MTSPTTSRVARTLAGLLFFCLAAMPVAARAQQAQDFTEEQYKLYEEIKATTDAAAKVDKAARFLKENPKTSLREHVLSEYHTVIVNLGQQNNYAQIITLGEKFLAAVPDDDFTFAAMAEAYSKTNNTKGFAAFGEKAYAANPSGQLAHALAGAYQQLGNQAKFAQWGERALAKDSGLYDITDGLTRYYLSAQDTAKANKYAKMTVAALPKAEKPATVSAADWKKATDSYYATAYYTIGISAYQNQSYTSAITNLEKSVGYYKRNDTAYYHLGLAHWQSGKSAPAMLNFAKAYVLKGSASTAARQYLEKLWKSSHRGSLTGVENVIKKAEEELK